MNYPKEQHIYLKLEMQLGIGSKEMRNCILSGQIFSRLFEITQDSSTVFLERLNMTNIMLINMVDVDR